MTRKATFTYTTNRKICSLEGPDSQAIITNLTEELFMGLDIFTFLAGLCPTKKGHKTFRVSRSTEIVDSTALAAKYFRKIWDKEMLSEQEQVYVILINADYQAVAWYCVHTGGVCQTVLDARVLVTLGMKHHATGMFIAHNHPSGKLAPSKVDRDMTTEVLHACKIFTFELYDHIIISQSDDYYSFRESGFFD